MEKPTTVAISEDTHASTNDSIITNSSTDNIWEAFDTEVCILYSV